MFGILLIKKTQGQGKLCFIQQEEALAFGSEGPRSTLGSVPRATYYLYVYFLSAKEQCLSQLWPPEQNTINTIDLVL